MVLSEPVDPLTVAVPAGWTVLPTSPMVLPAMLRQLAVQHTQLAPLLIGQAIAANEGAVRLFAYTTSPATTYAAIISYASPASTAITADMGPTFSKYDKYSANVIAEVTVVPTPAGLGLRLRAATLQPSLHVAFENLTVINSGRAVQLQVAADVSSLSFPPRVLPDRVDHSHRLTLIGPLPALAAESGWTGRSVMPPARRYPGSVDEVTKLAVAAAAGDRVALRGFVCATQTDVWRLLRASGGRRWPRMT